MIRLLNLLDILRARQEIIETAVITPTTATTPTTAVGVGRTASRSVAEARLREAAEKRPQTAGKRPAARPTVAHKPPPAQPLDEEETALLVIRAPQMILLNRRDPPEVISLPPVHEDDQYV